MARDMSSWERMKKNKKIRNETRAKQRAKFMQLPEEERKRILEERNKLNYKSLILAAQWDIEHNQLPDNKKVLVLSYIKERLKELKILEQTNTIQDEIRKIHKLRELIKE